MQEKANTRPGAPTALLVDIGCATYEAPGVGPLWIAWVPEGVVILSFSDDPPAPEERARWWPEAAGELPERPLPALIREGLDRYFAGEPVDPAELPARIGGTHFQAKVWRGLRRVGRGSVRTYAGLASDVRSPRAMRAVGMAMGANPIAIVVPCHRIVAAGHTLGGYSGGLERKRFLLELEGVKVDGDQVLPGQLDLL